jgi:hypothetical protein
MRKHLVAERQPDKPERSSLKTLQECRGRGCGLRFDFSFLVLRTDLAFPIRKPYLQEDRWVLDQVRLGASSWRKENLVLTSPLAIHFNSVFVPLFVYS